MTAQQIKALRTRLGLTQGQMAERLGVARPTYQQWEYGRRKPRRPTLKLLEILTKEADER
jgi:DNA-binding transcriptional regulator YiaG